MLTVRELALLDDIDYFIDKTLDHFTLVGEYPPHNVPPFRATPVSWFGSALIANGVRANVVQFVVPSGFAFRLMSIGFNCETQIVYDAYLMNGGTAIDPWNPVPSTIQVAVAEQFCTVMIRRHVPLWFKGPVTIGIDIDNTGANPDTYNGHLVGWIMPDSVVPGSDMDFYREGM
jgi:hypothetical protein